MADESERAGGHGKASGFAGEMPPHPGTIAFARGVGSVLRRKSLLYNGML